MRYLFIESEESTKKARMEYLFDIVKLYTLEKEDDENFIILDSFPFGFIDVFFIIGHDNKVCKYLEKNIDYIEEKTIVAITCNPSKLKKFETKGKEILVAKNKKGITDIYDGKQWGFEFQITDSEIDFYNNRNKEIMENLRVSMINIKEI